MDENITELLDKNTNESNTNITEVINDNFVNKIEITPWIVGTYYCVLVIGVLINFCLIISLLQQKRNGTTYLILQFAVIDIASAWVAVAEISSLYTQDWKLHTNLCPLFLGTEVLINVLTVYMHIILNFHAISTWNMQKNTEMSNKNPLTSDVDESNECLVWSEPPVTNRTLNIDYRHKRTSVSIIVPCILVWFSCLSLSIPEYTLSTTVDYHMNQTLCTIVDLHYTQLLQFLLIAFRGIIPIPLLLITFIIVIFKLCNNTSLSNVKKNSSAKKFNELRKLLLLSIVFSLLYTALSFQRSVIHFLHIISQQLFGKTTLEKFKMPPLDNFIVTHYTNMFLSMLHYSAVVLRPVLCIITMPSIMETFRNCIFRDTEKSSN